MTTSDEDKELLHKLRREVEANGWGCLLSEAETRHGLGITHGIRPPYAHTVNLHRYKHPDLLLVGLNGDEAFEAIKLLIRQVTHKQRFFDGQAFDTPRELKPLLGDSCSVRRVPGDCVSDWCRLACAYERRQNLEFLQICHTRRRSRSAHRQAILADGGW